MLLYAHRGASGYAPENTAAAFDLARTMGATHVETDLAQTRDGQLVLFHDRLVDRTSDGSGPVADYSLAELRQLDLGNWLAPRWAGQRLLTLEEFRTDWLPYFTVALEIKDPLACDPALTMISGWAPEEQARLELTSFHWGVVLQARAAFPQLVTGFLAEQFTADIIGRCLARGLRQICPPADQVTPELVARAHEGGLIVRAWGIKQRPDVDRLRAAGVDGATCNWPDWF